MTNNEQKTIDQLCKIVSDIKTENRLLTEKLSKTIEEINTKVNQDWLLEKNRSNILK